MHTAQTALRIFTQLGGAILLLAAAASATEVQVLGVTPGRGANLSINSAAPIKLQIGETAEGVQLLSVDRDGAVVRIDGVTQTVPLGAVGGAAAGSRKRGSGRGSITLASDARGHFVANGAINNRPIKFLVDTGASVVALSRKDADRLRLDYRDGSPARAATANGVVRGWNVILDSVSIGDVMVRDVEAMVLESPMSEVLLGMSFLNHFDMQRQGSSLILRRH